LEFIGVPNDLMAYVEGKSRIGRMGLIIATATQVAPGFHGVVVLELANTGVLPIVIKPGMAIAQLVFHKLDEKLAPNSDLTYKGAYDCQIKPIN
jgi:dCTP deaminase